MDLLLSMESKGYRILSDLCTALYLEIEFFLAFYLKFPCVTDCIIQAICCREGILNEKKACLVCCGEDVKAAACVLVLSGQGAQHLNEQLGASWCELLCPAAALVFVKVMSVSFITVFCVQLFSFQWSQLGQVLDENCFFMIGCQHKFLHLCYRSLFLCCKLPYFSTTFSTDSLRDLKNSCKCSAFNVYFYSSFFLAKIGWCCSYFS